MAKVLKAKLQEVKLDLIDEPAGIIRLEIDQEAVKTLAENIDRVGLQQPIVLRPIGERFEIVAGHRRYLAHKLLGRDKIAGVVRAMDDMGCALARASENIRRVDLSAIEEAAVYSDLRDRCGMTIDQIGEQMGKTTGVVKRRLDLLKMPGQLQKAVHKKEITYGVAEELWRISDIGQMEYYLSFAIEHGVTVAVARVWVKDWKDSVRRSRDDVEGGGYESSPLESRPVWVTCDICHGPMEIGTEEVFRCCAGCSNTIRSAVVGGES